MKQLPAPAKAEPMKDSLQAQLLAIEEELRKKGERRLGLWLTLSGVEVRLTLTPKLTDVALRMRAEELRKEIGARTGSDSFKAFLKKATGQ